MNIDEEEIRKLLTESNGTILGSGPRPAPPLYVKTDQGDFLFLQVFTAGITDTLADLLVSRIAAYTATIVIKQLKEEGVIQTPTEVPFDAQPAQPSGTGDSA